LGRPNRTWEVDAILDPEHRGRGVGTAAHRLLVAHLFDTTIVHRLSAYTEAANLAEQRCLEKSGFRREGVMRAAGFRGGQWRDVFAYARLRDDTEPSDVIA
jgi:RimJ/RimL family protein N-acetyltransferase